MGALGISRALLALAIGYVLGSVLPAEWFARRRGVDLKSVGDGNPGTWNAFRAFGRGPGLVTLVYDVSVGIVAIQVARLLGTSEGIAYLAGIMSVVGHRFPVFKRFRAGGQGMAASAGLVVYGVAEALGQGWLSPADIGVVIVLGAATYVLTRSPAMAAVVLLPVLVIDVILGRPSWEFAAFMLACAGYIWIVQLAAWRCAYRALRATAR